MSTEPELEALVSPSPKVEPFASSLIWPAPPLSLPSPPLCLAVRCLGEEACSCCWEVRELLPGRGPTVELLLAMKFPCPHPMHLIRREGCLPCQFLPSLCPQLSCPHCPSPFSSRAAGSWCLSTPSRQRWELPASPSWPPGRGAVPSPLLL